MVLSQNLVFFSFFFSVVLATLQDTDDLSITQDGVKVCNKE